MRKIKLINKVLFLVALIGLILGGEVFAVDVFNSKYSVLEDRLAHLTLTQEQLKRINNLNSVTSRVNNNADLLLGEGEELAFFTSGSDIYTVPEGVTKIGVAVVGAGGAVRN